jgi:hypothetical protein
MFKYLSVITLLVCVSASLLHSQDQESAAAQDNNPVKVEMERWNLLYQATSIGQYHGTFNAPYAGRTALPITRNTMYR